MWSALAVQGACFAGADRGDSIGLTVRGWNSGPWQFSDQMDLRVDNEEGVNRG